MKIIDKIKFNELINKIFLIIAIILAFSTKIFLLIGGLALGIFFYKKKWKLEEIISFMKQVLIFKFYILLIHKYGNMEKEFLRILFLIFCIEIFYLKKKIEFKKLKVALILAFVYLVGLIFNFLSPGGLESLLQFKRDYSFLMVPLLLDYLLENGNKNYKKMEYIIGIVTLVFCIRLSSMPSNIIKNKADIISLLPLILTYLYTGALFSKNKYEIISNLLLTSSGMVIIIKSEVRGAIIAACLGFFIGNILVRTKRSLVITVFLSVVLAVYLGTNLKYKERFFVTETASTRLRKTLRNAGIYTFKNNIIFGSGRENTQKFYQEYSKTDFNPESYLKSEGEIQRTKYEINNFPDSHNIFIDFLAEYGILGVIINLLLLNFPIILYLKYKETKDKEYIRILAAIMAYYMAGMSWSIISRHSYGVMYFIVFIWMYSLRNQEKNLKRNIQS